MHCGIAETVHCGIAETVHCGIAKTVHCGIAETSFDRDVVSTDDDVEPM
jgi:hypothetical protein